MKKNIVFFLVLLVFPIVVSSNTLSSKLSGKILLQVEQNGEAWYVNPANNQKYYMGRPTDAFNLMRQLGIGISDNNLTKIQIADTNLNNSKDSDNDGLSDMIEDSLKTDKHNPDTDNDGHTDKKEILSGYNPKGAGKLNIDNNFAKNQKGKIFLQVEQNGEAWYVNPENNKRYFLGRPTGAFNLMRNLGLGISDNDLKTINTSADSQIITNLNLNTITTTTPSIPTTTPSIPTTNIVNKENRLLGIDITMSNTNNYDDAFNLAKNLGMEFTNISLPWDEIEPSINNYNDEILTIANIYYPPNNTKIVLTINPIDTNNLRLPSDLKNKKFNDNEVIQRFKNLLDHIFLQIPDVELVSLSIGNEIDAFLGNDQEKWTEYEKFFKEISLHLNTQKPNIKIGTKITFNGITKNNIDESKSINQYSSVVMSTYYPLNNDFTVKNTSVISPDFDAITTLYNKEIQFLEVGYPTGTYTKSSEDMQDQFVKEIFKAWDTHSDQIKILNFDWLHDRSSDDLEYFKNYYNISDIKFIDYLGTLGLVSYDGQIKPAFTTIKKEIEKRGW